MSLSLGQKAGWGLADMGIVVFVIVKQLLILAFMNSFLGIPIALAGAVTTAVLIFDIISDPIMSSETRASRKVRTGVVVSDKRDKTVTVSIELQFQHPKYGKIVKKTRKLHAHDESFDAKVGDTVKITETKPISKTKMWSVTEIVERAR